ncbi:MAG: HlyD family secretion protein [Campylobacterota bacterium]|nr:HlyD family secretion protein [Campylobacterota bacterium]
MKFLFLLFFISSLLFSNVYYSKVEPYEIRDISSSVAGLIEFTDEDMIGKKLSSSAYIQIDSELDKQELKYLQEKLKHLDSIVLSSEVILKNSEKSLQMKKENYKSIASLKIKSDIEKDREFYDLLLSENQYLNTKKEIRNLKIQILDLKLKIAYLKRAISDKNLKAKGFVLYSILVKKGQVVGISTPLARIADVSSAKLTIYLDKDDVLSYKSKSIYIDGMKTNYKIDRILHIADSKNISKYMAQIVIESPKIFSKLVKVEFKNE